MSDAGQKRPEMVEKRIAEGKREIIEELRRTPIVQVACQRSSIGRTTYYRWYKNDPEFRKSADEAMTEGEGVINDLSEAKLIALMKEGKWPALRFWLEKRNPKYANKLRIEGEITAKNELTAEQREEIRRALELMSGNHNKDDHRNHEK